MIGKLDKLLRNYISSSKIICDYVIGIFIFIFNRIQNITLQLNKNDFFDFNIN
jgi:hypothetical protein